jgi:hypothetical protein
MCKDWNVSWQFFMHSSNNTILINLRLDILKKYSFLDPLFWQAQQIQESLCSHILHHFMCGVCLQSDYKSSLHFWKLILKTCQCMF